jgi:hypothetical protein
VPIIHAETEDDAARQAIERHLGGDWVVEHDGRDPNVRRRPASTMRLQ